MRIKKLLLILIVVFVAIILCFISVQGDSLSKPDKKLITASVPEWQNVLIYDFAIHSIKPDQDFYRLTRPADLMGSAEILHTYWAQINYIATRIYVRAGAEICHGAFSSPASVQLIPGRVWTQVPIFRVLFSSQKKEVVIVIIAVSNSDKQCWRRWRQAVATASKYPACGHPAHVKHTSS